MEGKLLSNLMKRVSKAPTKENQTKQQRNISEAERRVQFTEAAIVPYDWLTLRKSKKQSKSEQHPGNSTTIGREQLQATVQRHDNKLQQLMDEVNTKRRLGQRTFADSDRPNKLKVLYQQTVHLLEEEIPKQLQGRNQLAPYPTNFLEEQLQQARECKGNLDIHWFAYISKGTQPEMNTQQSNTSQAVNESESNKNYPTDNSATQMLQNGTVANDQNTENISETSSAKQRRKERMKKFDFEFETQLRLKQARFERRKLELEMQMKELETKHQLLEQERELERKLKRKALENNDGRSQ